MSESKILIIYDGPAFTFKLGLAIKGSKKGWIFIQHKNCKWVALRKAVDYENGVDKPIEVKPYSLTKKPFEDIWKEQMGLFNILSVRHNIKNFPMAFIKAVLMNVYNIVWKDIKKQLTGGE